MIVTQHTVADIFALLSAAFVSGVLLAAVYLLLLTIPQIIQAFKCPRFPSHAVFCERAAFAAKSSAITVALDITVCVLFAISLSFVSFLFNSGNFRLSSAVFMLIGFTVGYCLLVKTVRFIIVNIVFLIKWAIDILLYPFLWIALRSSRLVLKIYKKTNARRVDRLLEKHTKNRFSNIDKDTEFGLIEKFYKELIK